MAELLDRVGLAAGRRWTAIPGACPAASASGWPSPGPSPRAPDVLVCDEPVSALDVSIQAQVLDLLAEIRAADGTALLFISHDLGVVHHLADRVLVMRDGAVVEQGHVDDVFTYPRHDYTRTLLAALPTLTWSPP